MRILSYMDTKIIPNPSPDLLVQVRAGFVRSRTSLAAWCRANGVKRENARAALLGIWNGPKARKLRLRLLEASRDDNRNVA